MALTGYSGVSNNRTLCVYLFPRKILPCALISPVLISRYYESPVRLFILENTLPLCLFHTVRLLDTPEYN